MTGADGTVPESPFMGTIISNGETLNNVIYLPNIPYSIKSQYQLLEVEGWEIADWSNTSITYKRIRNNIVQYKKYARKRNETHKILVEDYMPILCINCNDENLQTTINKMTIIHENGGHHHPRDMVNMCDAYTPSKLGYTKTETITYLKYWESCDRPPCEGCLHGRTVRRFKDSQGKVMYIERIRYGDKEGIHFDVFYINMDYAFLIAKSHKYKMFWTINVGINFTSTIIQEGLEDIFGDYRYSGKEIHFLRSDADIKFAPLKGWLNLIGLRFFISPVKNEIITS